MRTATANYEFGCSPLLEEQVLRLQCLVAYLLEKDEQVWKLAARSREEG